MRTPVATRSAIEKPASTESTSGKWAVLAVSWAVGYFAVRALPGWLAIRVAGGMIAGTLVGLIPLAIAKARGDSRFGQTAMAWCVFAGAALGIILAGPVAAGFAIAAAKRNPKS